MIAELGQIFLAFAFFAAIAQGVFPLIRSDRALMAVARTSALTQLAFVALAFIALTYLHATSDFSVRNVFENSHTDKPFIYKISGVWGSHEGSMLLWSLILAGYGGALALARKSLSPLQARTLAIQGVIASAFLAFILFASNPFDRLFPTPIEGQDLNPLLQDPGLAIHPPFLYLGYVGFSMSFAFAAAGLIEGRIDENWAREVRPWALSAWVFLTIGIALGSWWAYYELGWGGFWAWDPVENASFMPWLAGTALIHSVRVTEVRGAFRAWTALMALLAFSLSLVGTFLVRSGIITSVHAFAVDPARGVFILGILALSVGGGLALFAVRAPEIKSNARFDGVSREGGLLVNNVLLVAACATVFIGTFYPLFAETISGEKLSVGAPYFNIVFTPFVLLSLLIIGPAAALSWKRGAIGASLRRVWPAGVAAGIALAIGFWVAAPKTVVSLVGVGLAVWAISAPIADLARRVRPGQDGFWARLSSLPRAALAMVIAHAGFGIVTLGVIGAGAWKTEAIEYVAVGGTIDVAGVTVTLTGVDEIQGANFIATRATFVADQGNKPQTLTTERRFYPVRRMQTTEAGVHSTLMGDLYLTIGDFSAGRGWVVRAWNRPLAIWMWIGAGMMALGGLVGGMPIVRRKFAIKPPHAVPAE